mmetsp:Transcript_1419/g.4125  ORF Transcript_1419/g.4125 Transcript_1419/m.4125 type:complete len:381 (-) Transcript_1419:1544-2686(-)
MPKAVILLMPELIIGVSECTLAGGSRSFRGLNKRPRPGNPPSGINILVVVHNRVPTLGDHETAGDAISLDEVGGDIGGAAGDSSIPSQKPHLGSRNADKVLESRLIGKFHHIVSDVVHHFHKAQHLHVADAGRVLEDIPTMVSIVKVIVLVGNSLVRSLHTRRVTADNEIGRTGRSARLGVELNLRRAGVNHRSGPDSHDSSFGIKTTGVGSSGLKNLLVLSDTNIEWDVILLGPATEGAKPQDRLLVALSPKVLPGAPHEVGMSGVGGIPRLEGIHGIGTLGLELLRQLLGGLAPLVQTIVVADAVQQLNFATDQVIAAAVNVLDVRMTGVNDAKHTGDDLLLAVVVHLRIAEDGNGLSHLRNEGDGALLGALNGRLGV